ncbi:SDR family NAD(P)-dependent oxidoreductase [Intrasporangium calvum]|uniref:SDR family NAD(P)-dependent oxidoreductase n=1 Tax=Intrasporangium calvum TaxID=53358 RepID=A0ABT5GCY8_9MICO|nr:SDR family NAD(P)-dependent oxidoreductase [Intrasporangium calvum]MDC5696094.1 SDR family NAD(P)-dependent oxidoreductase [Intrasporangium calvum]
MPLSSLPAPPSSRRVVVTGAASGLGLALARGLAARGDRVLATDLAVERPESVPAGMDYVSLDVRSDGDWAKVLAHVQDSWGGLDVLVNNAGIATGGRIDVAAMDEWHRIVDINLLGVVRGCRTFTPLFKKQGSGHLVNVASLAGLVHAPGMASYNAVKAGVVAISETLDHELAPHGIAVSVVCPAFFRTNLGASFAGDDQEMEAAGKRMLERSRRSADDVARAVIKGIDSRRDVILTDPEGRAIWRLKRFARPLYSRTMRKAGARLASPRRT